MFGLTLQLVDTCAGFAGFLSGLGAKEKPILRHGMAEALSSFETSAPLKF